MKKYIALFLISLLCIGAGPLKFPVRNAITETRGLVAYWPEVTAATKILDHSGRHNSLTAVQTTIKAGPNGPVRYFDGIDDYCEQQVIASGSGGTYYMATVDDGAFFWEPGANFAPYLAPSLANKPKMLVATDGAGRQAGGYIGGTGSGLTLGGELVTNGDFTAWTADDPDGWAISEDVNNYVTENPAGQCQFISDGSLFDISQSVLTSKKLYIYSIDQKVVMAGQIKLSVSSPEIILPAETGVISGYFIGIGGNFTIRRNSLCDITFDDVSVIQVTSPPANESVILYSDRTGSTQSLAWEESGFNANDIVSWEIRRTDFQIIDKITAGFWIKPDFTGLIRYLMSKQGTNMSFVFLADATDHFRFYAGGADGANAATASAITFENKWYFVVGTADGVATKIYINGVYEGSAGTPLVPQDTYAPLQIGGISGSFSKGLIVDAFICNRALSAIEIQHIFQDTTRDYEVPW